MKVFLVLLFIYTIYQLIELNRFSTCRIKIEDDRLKEGGHFVFLSDMHGKTYGKDSLLIKKIRKLSPDCIIMGGDIVSKRQPKQYEIIKSFVQQLITIAPVYYIFGNHETSLEEWDSLNFQSYIKCLQAYGVKIIRNEEFSPFKDTMISCYGLELPLELYTKRKKVEFPQEYLNEIRLRWKADDKVKLLFAHQPSFGDDYAKLNVRAIFSGHTHGGLVRIPGVGSILSTELTWFPKYDGGRYFIGENKQTLLLVSQGLGTHRFYVRIFDSAQLVDITLCSCQEGKN